MNIQPTTKGESLLSNLKELEALEQRLNAAARERVKEIQDEIINANMQLTDLESEIIEAKVLDKKEAEEKAQEKEKELLTRLSLLNQQMSRITGEHHKIISKKLQSLVPEMVEAEKEQGQFYEERSAQMDILHAKSKELQKQKTDIYNQRHPYSECRYIIDKLVKAAKLEKGVINQQMIDLKGTPPSPKVVFVVKNLKRSYF
jgi:hypothetical protein